MSDNRYAKLLAEINTDTVIAANTDALGSDFQPTGSARKCVITVAIAGAGAVRIRLIPNTGSGFAINGGSSINSAASVTTDVMLDPNRTWNVQTDDASGTTIRHLRIIEVDA